MTVAVGYVRRRGSLPGDQVSRIRDYVTSKRWTLVRIEEDVKNRVAFGRAVSSVADGTAQVLVAAELTALAPTSAEFTRTVTRVSSQGGRLVVLSVDLDTGLKANRALVDAARELTQLDVVKEKSPAVAASARTRGRKRGRSPMDPSIRERILKLRHDLGWSFERIAWQLNRDGVKTAQHGQRWWRSTIKAVVDSEEMKTGKSRG